MEFSKYFLSTLSVVWFSLKCLIQVPWVKANFEIFSVLNAVENEHCQNLLELSFP